MSCLGKFGNMKLSNLEFESTADQSGFSKQIRQNLKEIHFFVISEAVLAPAILPLAILNQIQFSQFHVTEFSQKENKSVHFFGTPFIIFSSTYIVNCVTGLLRTSFWRLPSSSLQLCFVEEFMHMSRALRNQWLIPDWSFFWNHYTEGYFPLSVAFFMLKSEFSPFLPFVFPLSWVCFLWCFHINEFLKVSGHLEDMKLWHFICSGNVSQAISKFLCVRAPWENVDAFLFRGLAKATFWAYILVPFALVMPKIVVACNELNCQAVFRSLKSEYFLWNTCLFTSFVSHPAMQKMILKLI